MGDEIREAVGPSLNHARARRPDSEFLHEKRGRLGRVLAVGWHVMIRFQKDPPGLLCGNPLHRGKVGSGWSNVEDARPNKDGAWTGCRHSSDEICWNSAYIADQQELHIDCTFTSLRNTQFPNILKPRHSRAERRRSLVFFFTNFFPCSISELSPKLFFSILS